MKNCVNNVTKRVEKAVQNIYILEQFNNTVLKTAPTYEDREEDGTDEAELPGVVETHDGGDDKTAEPLAQGSHPHSSRSLNMRENFPLFLNVP